MSCDFWGDLTNAITSCVEPAPPVVAGSAYFLGGFTGYGTNSEIDAMPFLTETLALLGVTLTVAIEEHVGNNSSSKGFATPQGNTSTGLGTDALVFSTETVSHLATTINTLRYRPGAVNSTTRGYIAGGQQTAYLNALDAIDGLRYDTEATLSIAATLATARIGCGGVSNTTNGYFATGIDGTGDLTQLDGILFSAETATNPAATLGARAGVHSSNSANRGYFAGGLLGDYFGTEFIDGIRFDTEAAISVTATLFDGASDGRGYCQGANSGTSGYVAGGSIHFRLPKPS